MYVCMYVWENESIHANPSEQETTILYIYIYIYIYIYYTIWFDSISSTSYDSRTYLHGIDGHEKDPKNRSRRRRRDRFRRHR